MWWWVIALRSCMGACLGLRTEILRERSCLGGGTMGRKPLGAVSRSGADCGRGKCSCSASDSGCWKHPGADSSASRQPVGRKMHCHSRIGCLFLFAIVQVSGDTWPRVSGTGLAVFCPDYQSPSWRAYALGTGPLRVCGTANCPFVCSCLLC